MEADRNPRSYWLRSAEGGRLIRRNTAHIRPSLNPPVFSARAKLTMSPRPAREESPNDVDENPALPEADNEPERMPGEAPPAGLLTTRSGRVVRPPDRLN